MAVNINVPSQVKTYANLAAFPATGALKTIYIAEDTNKTYRWTGSVYVEVSASAASGITIGTTAIASGVVGRVLFEGAGNVVQESSSLFWDATNNRLGIGTSTPTRALQVSYSDNAYLEAININNTNTGTQALSGVAFTVNGVLGGFMSYQPSNYILAAQASTMVFSSVSTNRLAFIANSNASGAAQDIYFSTLGSNTTYQMQIKGNTGNVQIGTNTDAGFRLDVNGTARVQGNTSIIGNVGVRATIPSTLSANQVYLFTGISTQLQGSLNTADTALNNNIYWDGTNLRRQTTGFCQSLFFDTSGDLQYSNAVSGAGGTIPTTNTRMVIKNNGNILINTTTDAGFRLDVNGTARVIGALTLGTGTAVASSISYGSTYGLTLYGNTGSNSDLLLTDRNGNLRFRIVNGGNILQTATTINDIIIGGTAFAAKSIYTSAQYGLVLAGSAGSSFNFSLIESTGINGLYIDSVGRAKIGAYNSTYNNSAILEAVSTTQGFLPPRMTTTQKNAIASPAAGLMVYDTTLNVISYYNGTMWI